MFANVPAIIQRNMRACSDQKTNPERFSEPAPTRDGHAAAIPRWMMIRATAADVKDVASIITSIYRTQIHPGKRTIVLNPPNPSPSDRPKRNPSQRAKRRK